MPLKVTLVSAEAEIWSGDANLVIAKTVEGEIGFMAGHEPLLAILADGQVRITSIDGTKFTADAEDGFVSVAEDVVTIVASRAALVA